MKIQRIIYLSLGSNQGNKLENLQNAVNSIAQNIGAILKIAPLYKTPSLGFEGEEFLNTCTKVSSYLPPDLLLQKIITIEESLGRVRNESVRYSNRTIDIDVLLFDDEILFSRELIVPHPRMLERKFVLIPLSEIAKETMHPVEKKTHF